MLESLTIERWASRLEETWGFSNGDEASPNGAARAGSLTNRNEMNRQSLGPLRLRLNLAAFGAAGLGVGGAGSVIGFLNQAMRLGHLKLPFDTLCVANFA
jgi:hypothetical protein